MIFSASIFNTPFESKENEIPILIIENTKMYQEFINSLLLELDGIESDYSFFIEGKEINLKKNLDLTMDLFSLNINKTKNLSKLYTYLKDEYSNEKFYKKTAKLNLEFLNYLSEICKDMDYSLIYNNELDIEELFKCVDLKFDQDDMTLIERLIDYIKIMHSFFKKKIFVLTNIKNTFSVEEQKHLYRFLAYEKIEVLIIENSQIRHKLESEIYRIIDEDLCVIY